LVSEPASIYLFFITLAKNILDSIPEKFPKGIMVFICEDLRVAAGQGMVK
jgi:hypothetical protein